VTYFIKCHSAMDQTYIGPFKFKKDALIFLRKHGQPEHDSWIIREDDMNFEMSTYGKVVVQTPEGFEYDSGR
jgi:hypothetical protein